MRVDFAKEVRSQVVLSDFISEYVSLKRVGSHYVGLSPFTNEKTPSFFVKDSSSTFTCYSSGKRGDVFTFVQEVTGMSFREALVYVAEKIGYDCKNISSTTSRYGKIYELNEKVASFFSHCLFVSDEGDSPLSYMKSRGFLEDFIRDYQIGYCPSSKHFVSFLENIGCSLKDSVDLGLVSKGRDGSLYSFFFDRIIFPIRQAKKCIGFGGRTWKSTGTFGPKYLNSKENCVFSKRNILYLSDIAFSFLRSSVGDFEKKKPILVEGYFDALSLHSIGFKGAMAFLGTSFNIHSLSVVLSKFSCCYVFFDGDLAGRKSAYKLACEYLPHLKQGEELFFAATEDYQDPSLICNYQGAVGIDNALNRALSLSRFLLEEQVKNLNSDHPEGISFAQNSLKKQASLIQDLSLRRQFYNYFDGYFKRRSRHFSFKSFDKNKTGEMSLLERRVHPSLLRLENMHNFCMLIFTVMSREDIYDDLQESLAELLDMSQFTFLWDSIEARDMELLFITLNKASYHITKVDFYNMFKISRNTFKNFKKAEAIDQWLSLFNRYKDFFHLEDKEPRLEVVNECFNRVV